MHELSIATALYEQVQRHTPAGTVATHVRVEAGPLQGIDSGALAFAWESVTNDTELGGAKLSITVLPWQLRCSQCKREWASDDMFDACACGNELTMPTGNDDLRLISLDVEPAEATKRN